MEVERSSSVDLSSAPASDNEAPNFNPFVRASPHALSTNNPSGSGNRSNGFAVGSTIGAAPATARQDNQTPAPKKPRKPRTTKPKDPSAASDAASKEKPARKPRASGTTTASRKKTKTETADQQPPIQSIPPATDLQSSKLNQPIAPPSYVTNRPDSDEAAKITQNGFLNATRSMPAPPNQIFSPYTTNPTPPQPSAPRATPMYDPVRGLTSQRSADPPQSSLTSYSVSHTPPRPVSRPGASPISSIIDPVPAPPQPSAPSPLRTFVSNIAPPYSPADSSQITQQPSAAHAMDLDVPFADSNKERKPSITQKPSSETPTRATSPKPARTKEQAPPLPSGSGLLSASLFGGESNIDANENKATGPNIVLHVDLKDPKNKVINFARLAEEKYGFAALYPRQAAQRERLARVAAAGAALERSASGSKHGGTSAGESGEDDVSVDIDRESDNDGDVNMSGINGGNEPVNSGTDAAEPKRKRRKKVEEYDQEDPFIDDTEQLWEAQAAASKDGFFVYCGPLVPEGEKPTVERYACAIAVLTEYTNIVLEQMVRFEEVGVGVEAVVLAPVEVAEPELQLLHLAWKVMRVADHLPVPAPEVVIPLENHG